MKTLLVGALFAASLMPASSMGRVARAQNQVPDASVPASRKGYDLLLEARALLPQEPYQYLAALPVAEQFRLRRAKVKRNALALVTVRRALQAGIEPPPNTSLDVSGYVAPRFIEQFANEAAVRADNGDAMGAVKSSLDALDLTTQIGRGAFERWFDDSDLASQPRQDLLAYAPNLDAAQSRRAADELERISTRRKSFEQLLREDQVRWKLRVEAAIADPEKSAVISIRRTQKISDSTVSGSQPLKPDESRKRNVTLKQFQDNNTLLFFSLLQSAVQPYQTAAPLRGNDAYSDVKAQEFNALPLRYAYERDALTDRLLVAALRLHAIKLESGAYPATFDAGTDPFSPAQTPLTYRRAGDSYNLYSVGPDGTDNGGTEFSIIAMIGEAKSGKTTVEREVALSGDIVAPVL